MKLKYNKETGKLEAIPENSEVVVECGDAKTRKQVEEFINSGAMADAFFEWLNSPKMSFSLSKDCLSEELMNMLVDTDGAAEKGCDEK